MARNGPKRGQAYVPLPPRRKRHVGLNFLYLFKDKAAKGLIAAFKLLARNACKLQKIAHKARAHAASPAVDAGARFRRCMLKSLCE